MAAIPAPSRSRGRPKGSSDLQRQRLLEAAAELLEAEGADLTLRQVALRAGVTPPLAHYYFGNRDGLIAALVDERARGRIETLLAAADELATQPVAALTRLMQRLTSLAAGEPVVSRSLLLPAGETLRTQLRTALGTLVQTAQDSGQLRPDLSAAFLAETLLGLCLFPFLNGKPDKGVERATALTLGHVALLQDGILARARKETVRFRGT